MRWKDRFFVLAIWTLVSFPAFSHAQPTAVVKVPIVDLRSKPSFPPLGKSDDQQLTQLLYGEPVEVVASSGDWVYVNATEQPSFKYHQRWEGYPGWIPKSSLQLTANMANGGIGVVMKRWVPVLPQASCIEPSQALLQACMPLTQLPLGSSLHNFGYQGSGLQITLLDGRAGWIHADGVSAYSAPHQEIRKRILETAALLIGDPYAWGGLSPADTTPSPPPSPPKGGEGSLRGIDCSGLVHLAYRVNGLVVPRDSIDQYRKAGKITRAKLKPGDLIFSASANAPKKITHVALYTGNGQIIEAPQTGMVVRKIPFKDKYGKDLTAVESGDRVGERVIYFGSFLQP